MAEISSASLFSAALKPSAAGFVPSVRIEASYSAAQYLFSNSRASYASQSIVASPAQSEASPSDALPPS